MRDIREISGMVVITVVFVVGAIYGAGNLLLEPLVVPPTGMLMDEWLGDFAKWVFIISLTAGASALVLYTYLRWMRSATDWNHGATRLFWTIGFVPPLGSVIAGVLLLPAAREGAAAVATVLLLTGLAVYYLSTALFAPVSHKYTAAGAAALRRW